MRSWYCVGESQLMIRRFCMACEGLRQGIDYMLFIARDGSYTHRLTKTDQRLG